MHQVDWRRRRVPFVWLCGCAFGRAFTVCPFVNRRTILINISESLNLNIVFCFFLLHDNSTLDIVSHMIGTAVPRSVPSRVRRVRSPYAQCVDRLPDPSPVGPLLARDEILDSRSILYPGEKRPLG